MARQKAASSGQKKDNSKGIDHLKELCRLCRYYILASTTEAGSGHPTTSLSATELMVTLMFNGFMRYDLENPKNPNNDRLIFSKGHAAPLLFSLYTIAGKVSEKELMTLRKFNSNLEGHPTMAFPYTEAATGSLGQGLSIGFGMALNAKYCDSLDYKTFVLLGDSEMAEGSVWEAINLASYYKLNNLIGILDVNRLGQRGETMFGYHVDEYEKRVKAFGWNTIVIDGHDISQVIKAYEKALAAKDTPTMIIAKTVKGKGVSFIEDKDGWHGKPLKKDELVLALKDIGEVDKSLTAAVSRPKNAVPKPYSPKKLSPIKYPIGTAIATRRAYGNALLNYHNEFPDMVVLDAETSNSTYAELFKNQYPERFFEMYIAEQNMIGAATGFSRLGKIPFCSTFAAFLSRATDQIRMMQYSESNVKVCGSHVGVSIGEDGASQMGLEDIAIFRTLINSVVLYPSDGVSTDKLVRESALHKGIVYIRTTRKETPILYLDTEKFSIGGSKTVKKSQSDQITVVGAGVTLHEALAAYEDLKKEGISIRVIDLYSIKPIDSETLKKAAIETKALIVVEDHYEAGGIGEAVRTALAGTDAKIISLCVRKLPHSGKPDELLDYEGISKKAIIQKAKELLKK